ncbi:Transposase [Acanthopleuribacter pedis]|uniref:Transposase n=2 Tax=Acanthopleuribacter pedis TaxID=442870 RepID=A0A8J7Q223_9BACT|nr:transposase [Acanthopleuribacter pedis]MBO1318671.1 transposase [Acanthopleuribacter pedis]
MDEWSQKVAQCCLALVDAFKEDLLKSNDVPIDETTPRVYGEKDRLNTTPSYMWAVRGGLPNSGPQTFIDQSSLTRSRSVAWFLVMGGR